MPWWSESALYSNIMFIVYFISCVFVYIFVFVLQFCLSCWFKFGLSSALMVSQQNVNIEQIAFILMHLWSTRAVANQPTLLICNYRINLQNGRKLNFSEDNLITFFSFYIQHIYHVYCFLMVRLDYLNKMGKYTDSYPHLKDSIKNEETEEIHWGLRREDSTRVSSQLYLIRGCQRTLFSRIVSEPAPTRLDSPICSQSTDLTKRNCTILPSSLGGCQVSYLSRWHWKEIWMEA